MTVLERQVKQAQRRLWLNRWLRLWGLMLCLVTAAWLVGRLADRLFGFHWPTGLTVLVALGVSLVGSILWLILTRDHPLAAATALDEAAGLVVELHGLWAMDLVANETRGLIHQVHALSKAVLEIDLVALGHGDAVRHDDHGGGA